MITRNRERIVERKNIKTINPLVIPLKLKSLNKIQFKLFYAHIHAETFEVEVWIL